MAATESRAPASCTVGPVTCTDFVRYAGAGGDFNRIHHDDEYARGLGFPSVFAMGMWSAGLLGAYAADWLGVAQIRELGVRFRAPVWPGDELVLEVADSEPVNDQAVSLVVRGGATVRVTGTVRTNPAALPPPDAGPSTPRLEQIRATEFEHVHFPVERGKILEFARAVRSLSGVHYDLQHARAAGYRDIVAPPTFTDCVSHWSGGDATEVPLAAGLDLTRVLHGEQRYRLHRPVVAGDVLTVRRRITDARTKPARGGGEMTLVTLMSEFLDESGEPVVSEEMLMIEQPPKEAP
jgi:acyl dehydratase